MGLAQLKRLVIIIIYISTYSETSFPILMCAYFCYGICENEISLSGCDLVTLSFKFMQLNDYMQPYRQVSILVQENQSTSPVQ